MSHKFAQSTSLLQTTDLIFLGDLEKVDENKAEFEIVTILRNGVNLSADYKVL